MPPLLLLRRQRQHCRFRQLWVLRGSANAVTRLWLCCPRHRLPIISPQPHPTVSDGRFHRGMLAPDAAGLLTLVAPAVRRAVRCWTGSPVLHHSFPLELVLESTSTLWLLLSTLIQLFHAHRVESSRTGSPLRLEGPSIGFWTPVVWVGCPRGGCWRHVVACTAVVLGFDPCGRCPCSSCGSCIAVGAGSGTDEC